MAPSQSLETRPSAVQGGRGGDALLENETLGEDSGYVTYAGGVGDFQTCVNAY